MMDIQREAAETRRLIDVFKRGNVRTGKDIVLRDKAKEIFERLDEEQKYARGNSIVTDLMKKQREEFEHFVVDIYEHRPDTPELRKYFFDYKKKYH